MFLCNVVNHDGEHQIWTRPWSIGPETCCFVLRHTQQAAVLTSATRVYFAADTSSAQLLIIPTCMFPKTTLMKRRRRWMKCTSLMLFTRTMRGGGVGDGEGKL